MPISEVFNCDCMEYMATLPDKFFDLIITSPPYNMGNSKNLGGQPNSSCGFAGETTSREKVESVWSARRKKQHLCNSG